MDTDGDRLWLLLTLFGGAALLRAWFSACETALTEVNDAKIQTLAETDKRWKPLSGLISAPTKLLRIFTIHRILSAVWIGVLVYRTFGAYAAKLLPIPEAELAAGALLALLTAVLMTIFTDFLPKRMAARAGDEFARCCVLSVRVLTALLTPIHLIAGGTAKGICKLFGIPVSEGAEVVTEEEIRLLVDAGNETGGIEEIQREMINNIFEFDDVTVSDVMTHRKDMIAVPKEATASETARLALEEGFSRIPVYEKRVDTIIGVVLVKDMLPLVGKAGDCNVTELMREAYFVPETAKCRDVFQKMRKDKMQLAIVSDEYGGTAGMVTMEDLLEEIVGSIQDEYDEEEEAEITELRPDVYSIDGAADPEDILPRLGVRPDADGEFDTMSAYVIGLLGHIPSEGERPMVEAEGVRYTLLSYEDNWIRRIQAEILPKAGEEENENR